MTEKGDTGVWLETLIKTFQPDPDIELTGTPEEMKSSASWKAFSISFAAAIPPGPFGMATIIPELAAITKIQINLVYRIAKYYGKQQEVTPSIVIHILATAFGIVLGRKLLQKVGTRIIVKALSNKVIKTLAQKLGTRIAARVVARVGARWIPILTAPIFGAFSKSQTTNVGNNAIKVFSSDIEFEKTLKCSQGHDVMEDAKFCAECGEKMEDDADSEKA